MNISQETTPALFADTPLLTPERLQVGGHMVFDVTPNWVHTITPLADIMPSDMVSQERRYLLVISKRHAESTRTRGKNLLAPYARPLALLAIQIAILLEATRYGGSVALNSREAEQGGGKALYYEKLTGITNSENVDVSRLWVGAGHGQIVTKHDILGDGDHSPGAFGLEVGPAKKDAREVTFEQARLRAAVALKGDVPAQQAYVANLKELFKAYDQEANASGTVATD